MFIDCCFSFFFFSFFVKKFVNTVIKIFSDFFFKRSLQPRMPSFHNSVKHTVKTLEQMLQGLTMYLIGIIGLRRH